MTRWSIMKFVLIRSPGDHSY